MYTLIHPSNIDQVWHQVAPWIMQAIGDSSTWSDINNIYSRAKDGSARIWIGRDESHVVDVVFVTETWVMDGRQICVIRWLSGVNMEAWLADLSFIENWASSNGFHSLHIWGRPGWIKVCKSLDYKHEFTVLSKPLLRGLQ